MNGPIKVRSTVKLRDSIFADPLRPLWCDPFARCLRLALSGTAGSAQGPPNPVDGNSLTRIIRSPEVSQLRHDDGDFGHTECNTSLPRSEELHCGPRIFTSGLLGCNLRDYSLTALLHPSRYVIDDCMRSVSFSAGVAKNCTAGELQQLRLDEAHILENLRKRFHAGAPLRCASCEAKKWFSETRMHRTIYEFIYREETPFVRQMLASIQRSLVSDTISDWEKCFNFPFP